MIATRLTEVLGKTVIVDNRTGADGIIGTERAVKAAPDGYTLIVLSAAYVMNPAVRKLPYDPGKALDFILKIGFKAGAALLLGSAALKAACASYCAARVWSSPLVRWLPGQARRIPGGRAAARGPAATCYPQHSTRPISPCA